MKQGIEKYIKEGYTKHQAQNKASKNKGKDPKCNCKGPYSGGVKTNA